MVGKRGSRIPGTPREPLAERLSTLCHIQLETGKITAARRNDLPRVGSTTALRLPGEQMLGSDLRSESIAGRGQRLSQFSLNFAPHSLRYDRHLSETAEFAVAFAVNYWLIAETILKLMLPLT